jgi:uncharacterized protein with beta-barrel porin domain
MEPRPAQAGPGGCTTSGTTASCTGNQSAGIGAIDFDQTAVDTLNVNSLTANIVPAAGTSGIEFVRSTGAVTINSDLTSHSIAVTGAADGIRASSTATGSWETGTVTINHTGAISSAGGFGIYASTNGLFGNIDINITSSGTITAYRDGINAGAHAGYSGDITIAHGGDIASSIGSGIYAASYMRGVTVTNVGSINAATFGIYAFGQSNVTVDSIGSIAATAGIQAYSGSGDAVISHSGSISSLFGIQGEAGRSVRITHVGGNITSDRMAIYADAVDDVYITNRGNLIGNDYGILAGAQIGVNVDSIGDITSRNGFGMYLAGTNAVVATSRGNIRARDSGIYAFMGGIFGYYVTVDSAGDITSSGGEGIHAVGHAGYTSVISQGNVSAYGDGIHAGSVGDTTLNSSGNVTSLTGNAIYAGAGRNIGVAVSGGVVSGAVAGINLDGGVTNTATIAATAAVAGGLYAIVAGAGNDTVNNSGTVTGNVGLGSGANAFNNLPGSVFNSGATANLGAGNMLSNSGTLAPFGTGTVGTTTLTGNFVQTAGGKFGVDVDLAGGAADRLNVSGTAGLAGTVTPRLTNIFGGPQTFTILSAAGGTSGAGLGLSVQSTAAVTYALSYPNLNDVNLTAAVNFAPSGLTPNAEGVAKGLQSAYLAGGGGLSHLLTYLATLEYAPFAAGLSRLTPEPYLAQSQAALWSGFDFANSLFSCPVPSGGASLMGEESCYWVRPTGHVASLGGHDGYMGFTEKAAGLTGGLQGELAPSWYLDVGAGYARSNIATDSSSATGDVFRGGAALKYIRDNWLVAGSVSGGLARYDVTRYGIPTAGTATADADSGTLDLRLRLAHAFGTPAFYVKPLVDLDAVSLWRGAINERGAGALNLQVQGRNDWLASAAPAVEIGTQWQQGGSTWRPYMRAGVRFLSKDGFSATASFQCSPAGLAPFTVTSLLDQTLAEVSAGFDVWQGSNFSLRLSYDGRFGRHTTSNGGALEWRAAF